MTTPLADIIVWVDEAMSLAKFPFAFGGALALAYHVEEPRATRDIDINVFVPAVNAREVLKALDRVAYTPSDVERLERDGQVRVFYEDTPLDLFLVNHPFHDQVAANVEKVPFLDRMIPILSATDLAVFKAFFNRTKDWADLEAMADARTFDVHVVIGWVVDLLGADDPRVDRLRLLLG